MIVIFKKSEEQDWFNLKNFWMTDDSKTHAKAVRKVFSDTTVKVLQIYGKI